MDHPMHLIGEDEEDIYEGFNEYNSNLDTQSIVQDEAFQQAVRTSHGRRQPVFNKSSMGGRLTTGARMPGSRMGPLPTGGARLQTGMASGDGSKPIAAVRAAGYTSAGNRPGGSASDPRGHQAERGPAPPLEVKPEDTPEEKVRQMEKKVNQLIEESCVAAAGGDGTLALEKAKEAGRKERVLVRQREQLGVADQINLDLTYSVLFNLANQYAANDMYQEALNTYQVIVKNKMFTHAGRLKVNMGNIYFKQRNYGRAIKLYRMALDQVPNTHKSMRIKIMQNIGIGFVKLGQYADAITSFENIMQEEPDAKTGFNLILCYFAMGDKQKMKAAFQKLLAVDLKLDDEDRYLSPSDDKQYELILEVIRSDSLRNWEKEKKSDAERCIKMAAKIIAPAIESTFHAGYDNCIDQVKMSPFHDIAHDLEIDKAIMYLKQKDFNQGGEYSLHKKAIETLKSFERKDTRVACTAATNLSFLYFLEGDLNQADKYSEQALAADRYNPAALVNKGNVLFQQKDYERAREFYREALQNDSSCVEALYNLGLCNKKIPRFEEALDSFFKLHTILRNNALVIYQIADIYEKMDDPTQSLEWFMQLHGIVSTDPILLKRLGDIHEEDGDKSFTAFYVKLSITLLSQKDKKGVSIDSKRSEILQRSFKYYPANLEVIEWLGAYYIESQFCEKAIAYFERAALMQPNQVKWQLMIASCHRRSGNYQQALETYKSINRRFPDNIECLQFLVRLCTDMGLKEAQDYANKLKKAEKQKEARETRQMSGRRGSRTLIPGSGGTLVSRENSASASSGGGSREGSALRGGRGKLRGSSKHNFDDDGSLQFGNQQNLDEVSYSDPLGPAMERPRTAARTRGNVQDEFADEEIDDNLLPD